MQEFKVEIPSVFPVENSQHDVLDSFKRFIEPKQRDLVRHIEFLRQTRLGEVALQEHLVTLVACQDVFHIQAVAVPPRKGSDELALLVNIDSPDLAAAASDSRSFSDDDLELQQTRFHNYVCGVVPVAQRGMFERALFRITRGNTFLRFHTPPPVAEEVAKCVFCVAVVGKQLPEKVTRMATQCGGVVYPVPGPADLPGDIYKLKAEISDLKEVISRTETEIVSILRAVAFKQADGTSPLLDWQSALQKEREIFTAMCQVYHHLTYITIEGWVPSENIEQVEATLHDAVAATGLPPAALIVDPDKPLGSSAVPPTYFQTSEVTEATQSIVDTYGVPRYKEVNPGLFTLITFPFLFGVMFGDVGHGSAIFLFSLWLVMKEKSLSVDSGNGKLGEIFDAIFHGRYLLLLMGAFAVYSGFIYSDFLSMPIRLFDSGYSCATTGARECTQVTVYPFGIDPVWYHTKNSLNFFNSFKMKLSVIIGVTQMTGGLFLSMSNNLYFNDRITLYFQFVPSLLFFLSTFGYMVAIILYKWCQDWTSRRPPGLIQTMINMFLQPGHVAPADELYPGQAALQTLLLLVALLCVPVLLFAKPLILRWQHQRRLHRRLGDQAYGAVRNSDDNDDDAAVDDERAPLTPESSSEAHSHGGHGEAFEYSEVQIHQVIHTVEFVLSSVSNTASYLRLWALSLAHAELSEVFWSKLILDPDTHNIVFVVIGFGAWCGATLFVLLAMDVMECFLHALRLHWVEFQSKFFSADGYKFTPFLLK